MVIASPEAESSTTDRKHRLVHGGVAESRSHEVVECFSLDVVELQQLGRVGGGVDCSGLVTKLREAKG